MDFNLLNSKLIFSFILFSLSSVIHAVDLNLSKQELEAKWAARILTLIDQDKLPLIDLQTSIKRDQINKYFPDELDVLDDYGLAMMAADGYQRPKDGSRGYRWSNYTLELVNDYPDYFIPTTNGGTNNNWLKQKGGKPRHFIDQLEEHIRSGKYHFIGELDFRHYMSNQQCRTNKYHRDNDIPLNGENGHRVFQLASEESVPFSIHLDPEDHALEALEEMLGLYPKAKVVVAHFGQIRQPDKQKKFTPDLVRHLLSTYRNLYYDLANGYPNRKYLCFGPNNRGVLTGDTIIWEKGLGGQKNKVKKEYLEIFKDFPDRFVFAADYGGGRKHLTSHLKKKIQNFNLITKELSDEVKQKFAYQNAWFLLTGKKWGNNSDRITH